MSHRTRSARLFVAVDPPERVAERLQAWARAAAVPLKRGHGGSWQGVRVLDAHLLHATVLFLGERPLEQVPRLGEQLQACVRPPVELSVGAPLWLPPRRPRALAVELHDRDGALTRIHSEIETRLQPATPPTEAGTDQPRRGRPRGFHPHITVARLRPQTSRPRSRGDATAVIQPGRADAVPLVAVPRGREL